MDEHDGELGRLRERAYGPGADIAEDPAAADRLRLLEDEALARRIREGTARVEEARSADRSADRSGPSYQPALAEERVPSSTSSRAPDEDPEVDAAPADPHGDRERSVPIAVLTRTTRRMRLRFAAIATALVIVVATITATTTAIWSSAVIAPIYRGPDSPRQVAVLQEDQSFVPGEAFFSNADSRGFGEFRGLLVLASPYEFTGGQECVLVLRSADYRPGADSINGPIYSGCAVGEFPSSVVVPVDQDAPEALREEFPDGTGIQFVLDGDRVGVFTDAE